MSVSQESHEAPSVLKPGRKRVAGVWLLQYLLSLFFVGGLEVVTFFDWRSMFWAAVLLAVIRGHLLLCDRFLSRRLASFAKPPGLFLLWLPLHCVIWMFCLNPLLISKSTTYVTEPLVSDGSRPDYFLALSQHVTPEHRPEENGFQLLTRELSWTILGLEARPSEEKRLTDEAFIRCTQQHQ